MSTKRACTNSSYLLSNPSQVVRDLCKETNWLRALRSNLRSNEVSFANRGMAAINEVVAEQNKALLRKSTIANAQVISD